ncbi:hypothetical protein EN932_29285 [Mesorhizobium sp. M7A.F.Ca.US.002.01.1.1]|nr:hypothetical protein EN932_29285 [Mesorhizobium sp. M7A.F.Ca.US.002.01.1.1]
MRLRFWNSHKKIAVSVGQGSRAYNVSYPPVRPDRHAAGHWSSFERNKAARPFVRYVHLEGQEHPRPLHALWHNTVLPVDHPWWNTHACPNGWNCHCTLQSLGQRDIDRLQREGEKLKFEPMDGTMRKYINKRTGEVTTVPDGIDPGWAYNPGKASYLGVVEQRLAQDTAVSEWVGLNT